MLSMENTDEPTKAEYDSPSLNFISSEKQKFYTFWVGDTSDRYTTHCNKVPMAQW